MTKILSKDPVAPYSPITTKIDPKLAKLEALKGKELTTTAPNRFVEPKRTLITRKSPKQQKMIKQTMSALLQSNNNKLMAAKLLNISDVALYKRLRNYPIILEQLDQWHEQTVALAKKELQATSYEAVSKVTGLMRNSASERIQLDSAIEVLDRSGITKPNTQVQVNVLNDLRKDKQEYDL